LDRKDAAEVTAHGGKLAPVLTGLLLASGTPERALAALGQVELGRRGRALAARLGATVTAIRAGNESLRLTIDPVEFRGFRYENGVSVSIFAPGKHEVLGRGGRYLCGDAEPATGLTLYSDAILRAAPKPELRKRVFVPASESPSSAAAVRRDGHATVAALSAMPDDDAEAARLGCTHLLRDGKIRRLLPETHTGD
jgi:ATP phosphoribosyltransferase regulatory subunit